MASFSWFVKYEFYGVSYWAGSQKFLMKSCKTNWGKKAGIVYSSKNTTPIYLTSFYIYIYISGGPLSALTCCVNVRLLSGDKKNIAVNLFSKLGWELGLYYANYDDFHPGILARMYT